MARYIAQRLLQLFIVLVGVSMVVFVAMHLLPGDVAQEEARAAAEVDHDGFRGQTGRHVLDVLAYARG